MAEPVGKRRMTAAERGGSAGEHDQEGDLTWAVAWSTEMPVEAERAREHLEQSGIRARVITSAKRHAAMNVVEYSQVLVPPTEAGFAAALLDSRPDLFPAATSYSEPWRYRRGMRDRIRRASWPAKVGYGIFVGISLLVMVAVFGVVLVTLSGWVVTHVF